MKNIKFRLNLSIAGQREGHQIFSKCGNFLSRSSPKTSLSRSRKWATKLLSINLSASGWEKAVKQLQKFWRIYKNSDIFCYQLSAVQKNLSCCYGFQNMQNISVPSSLFFFYTYVNQNRWLISDCKKLNRRKTHFHNQSNPQNNLSKECKISSCRDPMFSLILHYRRLCLVLQIKLRMNPFFLGQMK